MTLAPRIEGSVPIRSPAGAFVDAFRRRVEAGRLMGQPHPRSNYALVEQGPRRLLVAARDWRTAINVGLNELELGVEGQGRVQYRVGYWRWSRFGLGIGGILGLIGFVLLLTIDVRDYIARQPSSQIPGLSLDQQVLMAWAMVIFWGFLWPWVLIAMHKRPLHHLVERLVAEVDAEAAGLR